MKVWRLAKGEYAVPNGEGAKKYGGRWNPPGIPVVYTSESLALAVLEILVHTDSDLLPTDLVILSANIPDTLSLQSLSPETLPNNWRDLPAPPALQVMGADWVRTNKTVGLRVPSAIVGQEYHVLLNPAHPDFPLILWEDMGPFPWDPRLKQNART